MTTLKKWIRNNNVKAVRVQTDTDTGSFTTRTMSLGIDGDYVMLDGTIWWADEDAEPVVSTDTLFLLENDKNTITLRKA